MKHCKKNLTLAKTLSVHQLNCAIRRNFQLIGSCFNQVSPKFCTMSHGYFYHESHTCSDCPAGNIGILNSHMGSIQQSHQQFGTITRNLQRSNKNNLPYLFGLFLGDPSYDIYSPKHFGSRVDILIGLLFFFPHPPSPRDCSFLFVITGKRAAGVDTSFRLRPM